MWGVHCRRLQDWPSWYNGVTYRASNVLDGLVSYHFSHHIGMADGLFIGVGRSGGEGEGKGGVVSLAGRGSGNRDQS